MMFDVLRPSYRASVRWPRCGVHIRAILRAKWTVQFFHAAPSPQPVVVGPYMSNFELFYYLIDVLLLDV